MNDETEIRRTLDSWAKALHAKDVAAMMAHYAPDVLLFDLAPPLQHERAATQQGLTDWFATWDGPIGHETRNLTIVASGGVAFAHSLNRFTGRRTDGTATDVWFRATVGLRRLDGGWTIVHEHASVPMYMDGSFKAAIDLRP